MDLSAVGVESDDLPSIHAIIDLAADSAYCTKSYYSPKYKDFSYSLTKDEIRSAYNIIKHVNLDRLKKNYTTDRTDQAKSTVTIYSDNKKFIFEDYGLVAKYPLQDLYKIVYKLDL